MSDKTLKTQGLAYAVAGELFEKLRARGETPGDAMREAARTLRAHRRDLLSPKTHHALPKWARGVIEVIALENGVSLDTLRRDRHSSRAIQRIRAEAIYIVRAVGNGSPSFPDLGLYFGRDHSSLVTADQRFRARMEAEDILRARVEKYLADRGFVKREAA